MIAGLLELAFPIAINVFIDDLLPGSKWNLIVGASLGLVALYAVSAILTYIVNYWGHMLGINIETDMRRKLFTHIQKLSFRFFDNTKTGHLIGRLTNDMNMIGEMAHHGPEDLFIAVMTLAGSFALMLSINWQLALLTFIIVPAILWVVVHFNQKMTKAIHQLFRDIGDFNARIEDSVGGIRVVKAFSNEAHEEAQFAVNNGRFRLTKLASYKLIARNGSISYVMMRFVTVFVMVCGTWFVIRGRLSYGEFVSFLLLTNVFFRPIEKINAIVESYPQGFAGFKRYTELLDTDPDVEDAPDAVEMKPFEREIRFQGVSFGYEGQKKVLDRVSLRIRKGETVAFVGPSGAGKTTLCSLLPRFYEVESGAILVDGVDIRRVTQESLRSQIGIVQQDVFLFSGTIRDNILYGKLGASEDEVWEAARRPEAASGDRPHVPEKSADPDPRRSDFGARHRDGAGDSAVAYGIVAGADDAGHCASAGNDQGGGPHCGRHRSRHRRTGPAPGAGGRRRHLQPLAPGAIWHLKAGGKQITRGGQ